MPQKRIIFHGRVQGVGFRYSVHQIAARHPVTGFVRNLIDGTVELVLCGDEETIRGVVDEISQSFDGYITRQSEETVTDPFTLTGFEIRR